jgi:inhibitor of cysteine peptidase
MPIKKLIKILWLGALILAPGICVGFTDPNAPIIVEQSNPTFTITLESNPTTGYSWSLKDKGYDEKLISLVNHKFYPPTNKTLVGAPGYEEWIFKVNPSSFTASQTTTSQTTTSQTTKTTIALVYIRPWEKQINQNTQPTNFKVEIKNDN